MLEMTASPVAQGLAGIRPVDADKIPAQKLSIGYLIPEPFHEDPAMLPHFDVRSMPRLRTAIEQADGSQAADHSAAHLAVRPQAAAEGVHGFDQGFISYAEFFLPDRKNGLASMQSLRENPDRLFLHL